MENFVLQIVEYVRNIFGNDYIAIFVISILPTIEVKGAIPIAISLGLNPLIACFYAVFSSFLVCPLVLLTFRPILRLLKKNKHFEKFAVSVENVFIDKAKKLENKKPENANFLKMLLIFLFVAIPLPLAGVWTGSGVSAFLEQKYRYSIPPVLLGNLLEGLLITAVTVAFGVTSAAIILIVVGVFMVISLVCLSISIFRKSRQKSD